MKNELIIRWQNDVLAWYGQSGRKLPWRETTDPYMIFISELMLQQTQVDRVIPKYHSWKEQFPNPAALARASVADVTTAWAGLGYNRRALFAQRAAQAITMGDSFPKTYEELISLPGVGPYTAAAICSFAYNQDVALVDTNIKRIYQLIVFGDKIDPKPREILEIAEKFLPKGRSRDWHNALMDIGTALSRESGASNQQKRLIALFPSLEYFDLPLVSDQPLKRPRQSNYRLSRRFWRGKILDLLRLHNQLTIREIKKDLTARYGESQYTIEEIIASLEKDGFIQQTNLNISLKGRE